MRHILLAAYALVCLLCLIWPVYREVGQHIEPFVLGLPASFAWVIGWVLTSFVVLVSYYLADQRASKTSTDASTHTDADAGAEEQR